MKGQCLKILLQLCMAFTSNGIDLSKILRGKQKYLGERVVMMDGSIGFSVLPPKSTPIPVSHIISSVNLLKFHLYHSYFEVLLAVCKITDVEVIGVYYSE